MWNTLWNLHNNLQRTDIHTIILIGQIQQLYLSGWVLSEITWVARWWSVWASFHWLQIHFLTTLLYCLPRQHSWFFSYLGLHKHQITSRLPMGTWLGRVFLWMYDCSRAVVMVQLNRSLSISWVTFAGPECADIKETQSYLVGALSFLFGIGHWLFSFQCTLSLTWSCLWLVRFKHLSVWS